jgi:hypothetical protein
MALLIAILDAGLFIESAAERLPAVSIVGSLLSWAILAAWWARSAAAVGLLPSLLVIVLLALVMLAGHAWSYARTKAASTDDTNVVAGFQSGLFLGLMGHFFALYIAANPSWSIPPWPMFGVLAVLTLAVSITALFTRVDLLHAASVVAAMLVVIVWALTAAANPWPTIAVIAGAAVAAFALAWILVVFAYETEHPAIAAGIALFLVEIVAIVAAAQPGAPRLGVLIVTHAVTLVILQLIGGSRALRRRRWP